MCKRPDMRIFFLIFVVVISIISCKKDQKVKNIKYQVNHEATEDLVLLDDGNLWKANIETTVGINTMIKRMNSFSDKEVISSFNSLKDSLESDFTMIFQKCTMKGEAHNQLHNFLKPMVDLFEDLGSEDLIICKNSFNELERHLMLYENYFE